jgi:purine-nucleoside phosphorylase
VAVIVQQGRFHFYEGYPIQDLIVPLRVMYKLGAHTLIVTNAAGGVNTSYAAGDLMLITDHINLLGDNPLVGENLSSLGPRFCDMSFAYTPNLRQVARAQAQTLGIRVQEGVYVAMRGPSYETPAEIRMLRILGGDAVGYALES